VVGNYEYGPFGEVIRQTGPMAKANPFRFSTKYQDDETDLLYYGLRYYTPSTGTWPSRDPLNSVIGAEARFELLQQHDLEDKSARSLAKREMQLNDYTFVNDRPVTGVDVLGLCVALPDSGPGDFHSGIILHKIGKGIHLPHLDDSTLTFKVCCPTFFPYLTEYGQKSPLTPPLPTSNGNTFPYHVLTPPSGSGPCYTIVLEVPSTTAFEYDNEDNPGIAFLPSITIVGGCCCVPGGPTIENPPPGNGSYPPPPMPPVPPPTFP
jgi:RHS repeat-associated protein